MKKIKLLVLTFITIGLMVMSGCGNDSYEQTLKSGYSKFSSGNVSSMTDSEKRAVSNFLDWKSKN